MRAVISAGALLLLFAQVSCACSIFENCEPTPSSANLTISVLKDGKPVANARLSLLLPTNDHNHRSAVSDSNGNVVLKDLPEGRTDVAVTDGNGFFAKLCLSVAARSPKEASSFTMALKPMKDWFFSPENKVDWIEQSSPATTIKSLKGTVLDVRGAVIPNAEIQVYKRGTYPQNPVAKLKTDQTGGFASSLEPGIYTVIFRKSQFKSEILSVEVAFGGSESELRQTLQVGSNCDW